MEKNIVVSLYDIKAEAYEGLYVFATPSVGCRYFEHFKEQIPFYDDKIAYIVGTFDFNSGVIDSFSPDSFVPLFGGEDE